MGLGIYFGGRIDSMCRWFGRGRTGKAQPVAEFWL